MALFVLSLCPFDISVGVGAFVIGLGQISSFLSLCIYLGEGRGFTNTCICMGTHSISYITDLWILTKFGRDEVIMALHMHLGFSARSAQRWIQDSAKINQWNSLKNGCYRLICNARVGQGSVLLFKNVHLLYNYNTVLWKPDTAISFVRFGALWKATKRTNAKMKFHFFV